MPRVSQRELKVIWEMITTALKKQIPKAQYNAWIKVGTRLKAFDPQKECVLVVNNLITYNWLRENALETIADIVEELFAKRIKIKLEVNPKYFKRSKSQSLKGTILDPTLQFKNRLLGALKDANINPDFTFERFVVGPSNQLAYAASKAVADNPGQNYNPLFIYGNAGTGKTHLLHAIGEAVLRQDLSKKVLYITSEMFLNELISAIQNKQTRKFREKYRNIDVLLVDDIQFISKWEVTQDELFHTFNELHLASKQIVFASDRPPREIQNIADRLRTRFEGGMVVDIQPPDLETRIAILQRLNEESPIKLDLDVLEAIALFVTDNVRSLIGAYKRLTSYSRLTGQKVDRLQAEVVLGINYSSGSSKKITPERIIEEVAKVFHITKEDILGPKRLGFLVIPRQLSMYLIRTMLNYSLVETAKAVNRSDHTTVIYAIRKIQDLLKKDPQLQRKVTLIKSRLI